MLHAVSDFIDFVPACFEAARAARSADAELAARRESLVEQGRSRPLERLASLLVFLSNDNAHNGRDCSVIAEDFRCGVVADLLNLDIDELATHLRTLQDQDLVRPTPTGALQLPDIPSLELLASGGSATEALR